MAYPSSLLGEYRLLRCNGKPAEGVITLTLERGDSDNTIAVDAQVANSMYGELTYTEGVLEGILSSTRMMGSPYQNEVERILNSAGDAGLVVSRSRTTLRLSNYRDILVFVPV